MKATSRVHATTMLSVVLIPLSTASGFLASVKVSAEFQDAGTKAWVGKEAQVDCKETDAGWGFCTNNLVFTPSALATPPPK